MRILIFVLFLFNVSLQAQNVLTCYDYHDFSETDCVGCGLKDSTFSGILLVKNGTIYQPLVKPIKIKTRPNILDMEDGFATRVSIYIDQITTYNTEASVLAFLRSCVAVESITIGDVTTIIHDSLSTIIFPIDSTNVLAGAGISVAQSPVNTFTVTNTGDLSNTNEIQDLSLTGNTLSLSGDPTSVNLTPYLDNTDNQTLSIIDSTNRVFTVGISGGNTIKFRDRSGIDSTIVTEGYAINVTEPTNNTYNVAADTFQVSTPYDLTLKQDVLISGVNIKTVNGNTLLGSGDVSIISESTTVSDTPTLDLTLTGVNISGKVDTSIIATQYDLTLVNTDNQTLSIDSLNRVFTLGISNGNTVKFRDQGILTEVDGSTTNEIQDLSLTGNTLSLSGDPSTVDLSPYLDNTDAQTLTIDSTNRVFTVGISNGNTIKFQDRAGIDSTTVTQGFGIIVTEPSTNTYNVAADTSKLATQHDLTTKVKGHGVPTRVAWWAATDSLSSSPTLYWDVPNDELEIVSVPIGSNAFGQFYIGDGANTASATAYYSNFFGYDAGNGATSSGFANYLGFLAGKNATNANNSNFFGSNTGESATNAFGSNFIGSAAGKLATGAFNSNFLGVGAGRDATNAKQSNFFGDQAGYGAANASNSNFFGYNTGSPLIGPNNIIIGTSITLPDGTANAMSLGGVLFGTGFNSAFKISGAKVGGKIGILTPDPTQELHVNGNLRVEDAIYDSNNEAGTTGQILSSTATGTDWITAGTTIDSTNVTGGTGISVAQSPANTFTVTNTGDLSNTNEIQQIQKAGSGDVNLQITGGGGVGIENTLTNVLVPSNGTNGQILTRGSGNNYSWQNKTTTSDSTSIIGGWGIDATEYPDNTFNLIVDSTQVATPFDLTSKENVLSFTSPLSRSGNTISIPAATTSVSGYLTSTDWTTFNGKVGGSGWNTQVAYWTGSPATLTSNSSFTYASSQWNMLGRFDLRQTASNFSICIGSGSGNVGTSTGADNFWMGRDAGRINTSGYQNCTMGVNAMYSNTTGYNNSAIGLNSLFSNVDGYNNMAIGANALISNTNGYGNVAISAALFSNTQGYNNIGIGNQALNANTTGDGNLSFGWRSLYNNSTGNYNIAIGEFSLYNTTGSRNVGLGYRAGNQNTSASDRLYIENTDSETPLIGGDFSGNKVGINTPIGSIDQTLDVTGTLRITGSDGTSTTIMGRDADGDVSAITVSTGLTLTGNVLTSTGSDQYLNPYIQGADTTGFFLTVAQDTVVFVSGAASGEATTVGDTPTIDLTLTGVNITADVKNGSITPAKLDRAYAAVSLKATTTTFATSSTTAAEWTGGNFRDTIDATGYYKVELYGIFKSSITTTGGAYSIYSAGGTQVAGILDIANNKGFGTTNINRTQVDNMNNSISGIGTSNTTENHTLYGQLTGYFTSGDIIIPKFGSEIAASTVTYQAGTRLIITKLF